MTVFDWQVAASSRQHTIRKGSLSVSHFCVCSCDVFTDDVSISGFKDAISEQSVTENATEAAAAAGPEQEGGVSPDTVSATSQSIDEPTKDIVR